MKKNFNWGTVVLVLGITTLVVFAVVLGASIYAWGFQNGQYTAESLIHTYGNCTIS